MPSPGWRARASSRLTFIGSLVLVWVLPLAAASEGEGDRSRELLRYACSSEFGSHDLTLFANGTLRLWVGKDGQRSMSLAELNSTELASYIERLSTEPYDRSRTAHSGGPTGRWVEQCSFTLSLEGQTPLDYRFSRIESQSLDLAHRLAIADELLVETKNRELGEGFPQGYVPKAGDILLHKDGMRYRIERYTGDGRGLEIAGLDTPLLIYIDVSAVTGEFRSLEKRARSR